MLKAVRWCFMGLCLGFANIHAAPILQVDSISGKLTGATGVDVGGTLYDVQFVDGSCISVFSGCDALSDFTFDAAVAAVAAQSLLDQVLLDVAQGDFDSDHLLTSGCLANGFSRCEVATPYGFAGAGAVVATATAINVNGAGDGVGGNTQYLIGDNKPENTWAVWSASASSVPEPGTILCVAIAGLALYSTRRRRTETRCRI